MARPNQHPPVTRADSDRIVALYRQGGSIVQVAALVGRSGTTVQKVLRQRGVATRPPGARPANLPRLSILTDPTLAFDGKWVRVGMVWKPVLREAS